MSKLKVLSGNSDCLQQAKIPTAKELSEMKKKVAQDRLDKLKRLEELQEAIFRPIYNGKILSMKDAIFYVIVEEMTGSDWGEPFEIEYALSPTGDYIGDRKTAYRLSHKYGIAIFKKSDPMHNVCSIGYNPAKKLWYGWSHRAIHGFKEKRKAIRFARSVS